ncbi:MAG TPA: hypothetical protein VII75_05425 [Thermoanaerobaculia bacterium]|nr:hypothetical protein [Thermoanaerobaculia bacterium]
MLFFNDEGSENGGLIFGGHKNEKGEVVSSGGSLSFDRWNDGVTIETLMSNNLPISHAKNATRVANGERNHSGSPSTDKSLSISRTASVAARSQIN